MTTQQTVKATTISLRNGMFQTSFFEKGAGGPLLFLHGGSGLPEWPAWLDVYAERFRVIAPQHPGFGDSTGLEHLDDFVDLALYYLDLMDALGLDRPDILGQSFGGNIAAEIASIGPKDVGKLVLIAPTGLWIDAVPTPDFFVIPREEYLRAVWHDPEAALALGWVVEPRTEEERHREHIARAQRGAAEAKFIWPIPDKGLKKRIHRIKAPTLLVWGASDGLVPLAYGELFQKLIPGSRLVVIPAAGHRPMQEQPQAFAQAVLDFLGSPPASG